MTHPARAAFDRARSWASADDRVSAAVVYGSVARGTEHAYSDLDLLVVARDGRRDDLWAGRAELAAELLGAPPGFTMEPFWQRSHRYQAWSDDGATMIDLTFDEKTTAPWAGVSGPLEVLVDHDGVAAGLQAAMAVWEAPEADAALLDPTTWPWLAYLDGHLRKGNTWIVRAGCYDTLGNRVIALLGAAPHDMQDVLPPDVQQALADAAPRSSEPQELRRALAATVALYDLALDTWAARTGRPRPEHPLAPVVRARVTSP